MPEKVTQEMDLATLPGDPLDRLAGRFDQTRVAVRDHPKANREFEAARTARGIRAVRAPRVQFEKVGGGEEAARSAYCGGTGSTAHTLRGCPDRLEDRLKGRPDRLPFPAAPGETTRRKSRGGFRPECRDPMTPQEAPP